METIIETENLYLIKPDKKYLKELYNINADPRTNIHNPSGPHKTIDQTKEIFDEWLKHWKKHNFGYFMIINHSDELVGVCGVRYTELNNDSYLNLYYRISPNFMRKGYTKEACQSILDYLSENKISTTNRLVALTKKENIPSIKTAESLGFSYSPAYDDFEEPGDRYLFKEL